MAVLITNMKSVTGQSCATAAGKSMRINAASIQRNFLSGLEIIDATSIEPITIVLVATFKNIATDMGSSLR